MGAPDEDPRSRIVTKKRDGIVEQWLSQMNPDVRSLQPLYSEGKSRRQTYREMVETMLDGSDV